MSEFNHIDDLKSLELYKYLAKIDTGYAKNIESFVSVIAPVLNSIKTHFPFYTRHDARHGYEVVKRMAQIIQPECLKKNHPLALLPIEVFLLIASAYAHDVGMTIDYEIKKEKERTLNDLGIDTMLDKWEEHSDLQDYLRKNHAERGSTYIENNYEKLGVKYHHIDFLSNLMASHNWSIKEIKENLLQEEAIDSRAVNMQLLSVILCLSDVMEFSDTRVIDGVLNSLNDENKDSYRENMKHRTIGSNLSIHKGMILVTGHFKSPDVLSLAHKTFDDMEKYIKGYLSILHDSDVSEKVTLINGLSINRNLKYKNGEFSRVGIRIDRKNILNLISSNAIWQDYKAIPIRELLQNAVEACRYRNHTRSHGNDYTPEVHITSNTEENSITIKDNGCGMNSDIVLEHFLNVGNSRSKQVDYIKDGYQSFARFGVGFWSVFNIAKKANISTRKFDGSYDGLSFSVSIEDLKDYVSFEKKEKLDAGTTIKLYLKDDVNADDLLYELKDILIKLSPKEVDIFIHQECEDKPLLPKEFSEIDRQSFFKHKLNTADNLSVKLHQKIITEGTVSVHCAFAYSIIDGKPAFRIKYPDGMKSDDGLINIRTETHNNKVSIFGFSVIPDMKIEPYFNIRMIGFYHVNNDDFSGAQFSIDRTKLLPNSYKEKYNELVFKIINDIFIEFLEKNDAHNPEDIYRLRHESYKNTGGNENSYSENLLFLYDQDYASLLCFSIINKNNKIEYKSWKNINDFSCTLAIPAQDRFLISHQDGSLSELNKDYINGLIIDNEKLDNNFYLLCNDKTSYILFDNVQKFELKKTKSLLGEDIVFFKFMSNDITPSNTHDHIISIQGEWSGSIYFYEFITNETDKDYVFWGRNRLIVDKNSELHGDILKLFDQKRIRKLSQMIKTMCLNENRFC